MGITATIDGMISYTNNEWNLHNYYYRNVIEKLRDNKITSMMDIGGCLGQTTRILVNNIPTIKKVFIVEPVDENFLYIKENLLFENVEIVKIHGAVYYGSDTIVLGRGNDGNIGGYGVMNGSSFVRDGDKISGVTTVTIEEILKGETVDFIKMDVEGGEYNILKNTDVIKNTKILELEFHHKYDENLPEFIKTYLPNHTILHEMPTSHQHSFFMIKNN